MSSSCWGDYPDVLNLFLAFLLPFLFAQVALQPCWRLEYLLLLMLAVFVIFVQRRFLFLFVLVFAPHLAVLLARWLPDYEAAEDRLRSKRCAHPASRYFTFLPGRSSSGWPRADSPAGPS